MHSMSLSPEPVVSHRSGRSRLAGRFPVRAVVALVVVGLLVTACGSGDQQASNGGSETTIEVAGAQENAVGNVFSLAFFNSGYDRVEKVQLINQLFVAGYGNPQLLYGKRYYMRATVPKDVLAAQPVGTWVLQYRGTDGKWVSLPDRYVNQYNGNVEGWFTPPGLVGLDYFRLAEAFSGKYISETLQAYVTIQYDVKIHNRMKQHLKVSVPLNYLVTKKKFAMLTFDLDPGQVKTVRYINPAQGYGFGMEVENKDCHFQCQTQRFHPEGQDESLAYNCSNRPPNWLPGETYEVNLDNTPGSWNHTFAVGSIRGKFEAGAPDTSCVFSLRSKIGNLLYKGGTAVKVGEVVLLLVAVVAIVYVAVAAVEAMIAAEAEAALEVSAEEAEKAAMRKFADQVVLKVLDPSVGYRSAIVIS